MITVHRESQTARRMARGQSATPVLQSRTRDDVDVPLPKRHAHSARHYLTVEPPSVPETYRAATSPRHNYSGMGNITFIIFCNIDTCINTNVDGI